ncbi:cytochrome P450 736A117-like [Rosa rugosa]|uniref:cytochrome P450 736A117-like n=1 Tax=Rosa rugosa TaxID=74645 RepID=UPI002B40BAB7|nr:cytochrome P450 736A117-like [Rosa rugosa]
MSALPKKKKKKEGQTPSYNVHHPTHKHFLSKHRATENKNKMLDLQQMLVARSSSLLQHFCMQLILLAIFFVLLYKWYSSKSSSVPPSPQKLPVMGNLHQLGLHPHRSLQALAQIHGPLMLLHFGSMPVLIVSSAEAACEIMKTHDLSFSDRPKMAFFKKLLYNCKDVATAPYGEYWRRLKSICVLNLLSNSRVRSFRYVREEETESMINSIKQSCTPSSSSSASLSSVLNLSEMFLRLTNDVICRVALGRKYSDRGEGRGRMFMGLSVEFTELMGRVNIGDYIPWLAWVSRVNGLDAKLDSLAKRFDEFLDMVVQEHMDSSKGSEGDEDDGHKDLVDVLLSVQKENTVGLPIDRVSIKAIILDIFVAGTDTTFGTLEWTMSELFKHPSVMKKLQSEVRRIVGNKKDIITEDNLVEIPYLKAVIKESLRLHPPVPLLLPRIATQDAKINGYNILSGTQVLVNAWQIGRDPKSYKEPEEFKPERFMNNAIDYKGNDGFQFIPFGAGRRGCPGIQFAMAVQEIALANLIHKFDWVLPDGARGEDLDMTEETGQTVHRKYPLKAVAIPYPCQG